MNVLAWMFYASIVSVLAVLATMCADRAAAAMRIPRRWWWCAGMGLSLILPLLDVLGWRWPSLMVRAPNDSLAAAAAVPVVTIERLPPNAPWLSLAVASLWAIWSTVHVVRIVRSHYLLRRARHRWSREVIEGVALFVSDDMGPAAFGIVQRGVVAPRWTLALDSAQRQMVVRHELEHVRAHDTLLLLLARGCNRKRYGEALLDMSTRTSMPSPLLATLTEPHAHLHARIVAMSSGQQRSPLRAAVYAAVALIALAAACNSERGNSPQNRGANLQRDVARVPPISARHDTATVLQLAGVESRTAARPGDAPVGGQQARSVLPDQPARPLINGKAPIYPGNLRTNGIEGEVLVAFLVDTNGTADMQTLKVLKSSHQEFADAVRAALPEMRFDAARLHGRKVRQLIEQPFAFALAPTERTPTR